MQNGLSQGSNDVNPRTAEASTSGQQY